MSGTRYLNQPRPLRVRAALRPPHGRAPAAVLLESGWQAVRRIRDRWRVDDTWWREPLYRIYFEVELEDGRLLTLFHDRTTNRWFRQWYGRTPAEAESRRPDGRRSPGRRGSPEAACPRPPGG